MEFLKDILIDYVICYLLITLYLWLCYWRRHKKTYTWKDVLFGHINYLENIKAHHDYMFPSIFRWIPFINNIGLLIVCVSLFLRLVKFLLKAIYSK